MSDILKATKGRLIAGSPDRIFSGISIDTRSISRKDIFLAVKGDAHDGHDFIPKALEKGVQGFIIEKGSTREPELAEKGVAVIAVKNPREALGQIAAANRNRVKSKVIAITGSNGKTTTRKMTSCVISRMYRTLSTKGNFNNDIGLPLTLLNLAPDHEMAVVELGMNNPGEIRYLAEIATPDVGVITNVGPAHLKGLGTLEAVMRAKGELLEGIKPSGTAVMNADDFRVMLLAEKAEMEVVTYGLSPKALIRGESVREEDEGTSFILVFPEESVPVRLYVPGAFMVSNALAAAAAGFVSGLSPEEIALGLATFRPAKGRMSLISLPGNIRIIDDTYNANPDSMKAAIKTLVSLSKGKESILVAGDMYELGVRETALHREIGEKAAESGVTRLYATGKFAEKTADGALKKGMPPEAVFTGSKEEILENLTKNIEPETTILVKGSRAMAMETIVNKLTDTR